MEHPSDPTPRRLADCARSPLVWKKEASRRHANHESGHPAALKKLGKKALVLVGPSGVSRKWIGGWWIG